MKKLILILLLINNIFSKNETKIAQWTILTYIQANNDLHEYAHYSISHMQAGMQNSNGVNIIFEWDHIKTNKIKRCKIVPGEIELDSSFTKNKIKSHVDALVDSFSWAQKKYPAENYMLILWNHGTGVLDYDETYKSCLMHGRLLSFKKLNQIESPMDKQLLNRGILMDESRNTLFTNQNLSDALNQIKINLGKKIDILVMDACYMQMLEVAYQVKDSAQFLVASQEYESGEGLPYGTFIYTLTMNSGNMNALNLSQCIVSWYDNFYKNKQNHAWYTYSAIDLSLVDNVKENIKELLQSIEDCKKIDKKNTYEIVTQARRSTHEFYWTEYIDLYSFYDELLDNIESNLQKNEEALKNQLFKTALIKLNSVIKKGLLKIKKVIIANAIGSTQKYAYGLSIYYPIKDAVHESYLKTSFDKDTNWNKFVNEFK